MQRGLGLGISTCCTYMQHVLIPPTAMASYSYSSKVRAHTLSCTLKYVHVLWVRLRLGRGISTYTYFKLDSSIIFRFYFKSYFCYWTDWSAEEDRADWGGGSDDDCRWNWICRSGWSRPGSYEALSSWTSGQVSFIKSAIEQCYI